MLVKYRAEITVFFMALVVVTCAQHYFGFNFTNHTDADTYEKNARFLLRNGFIAEYWDESLRAWRPHGLTILVAAFYKIFGFTLEPVQFFFKIIFAASSTAIYAAARNLSNSPRAGLIASLLYWSYLPFYLYASSLLTEHLMIFLMTLALLILSIFEKQRKQQESVHTRLFEDPIFLLGVVLGIANWIKTNFLYLPVCFLFCVLFVGLFKTNRWVFRKFFVFALGVVITTSPYLIRNYLVIGSGTRIVSYTGYNLYLGNYGLQVGDWQTPAGSQYWKAFDQEYSSMKAELKSEVDVDDFFKKKAAAILALNYTTTVKKVLFTLKEQLHSGSGYIEFGLGVTRLQYLALLVLSLLGTTSLLLQRHYTIMAFTISTFVYNNLLISTTFAMNRFKEAIVPCLILLSACGIYQLACLLLPIRIRVSNLSIFKKS